MRNEKDVQTVYVSRSTDPWVKAGMAGALLELFRRPLAAVFRRNGVLVALATVLVVALAIWGTAAVQAPGGMTAARPVVPGSFYDVLPLWAMSGLALLTFGEGWHNNHHFYPGSARQGFRWWELDTTYYFLRLLALCGLIWDLRRPPPEALAGPLAE